MLLARWKPWGQMWSDMERLNNEMNRLFERTGKNSDGTRLFSAYPALNIWDDGENVYAEAEIPGLDLNDLEIYVTGDNQLTIKGERKIPELPNSKWHRRERGMGAFSRTLTLPVAVEETQVKASLQNGVLKITLPKAAETKPRRIPVTTN